MLSKVISPDMVSYNTLVEGYVKIERIDVLVIKDMIQKGVVPNHVIEIILKVILSRRASNICKSVTFNDG